ncbi:hypothetical protein JT26_00085 [Porphyromonas sp. COT-108 OH1349]|nr:hypothetical protein JT26_00085 [Porphyromonas sp. COT-108 OH1349]
MPALLFLCRNGKSGLGKEKKSVSERMKISYVQKKIYVRTKKNLRAHEKKISVGKKKYFRR